MTEKQAETEKTGEIATTSVIIRKMGKMKICIIPKSIKAMKIGDSVIIMRLDAKLIKYMQSLVAEDFVKRKIKTEWNDYKRERRYT